MLTVFSDRKNGVLNYARKMKLRLRLNKVARVIDIDGESTENFTVDDLCERVKDVFRDVISG